MSSTHKPSSLLFLVLVLLPALANSRYHPVDVNIHFNLRTQPIDALLQVMRQHLVDNMPRYTVAGRPCLAPKDATDKKAATRKNAATPGSPPGRWLKVHLVGETDTDRTTLAFGDSDIYLLGFTNISGDWNTFAGYETLFPGGTALPSVGPIRYSASYTDIAGGRQGLRHVPLGRAAALAAVRVLSRYNLATSDPAQVKRALATFILIISEGLRFFPVRNVYIHDWDGENFINTEQAELLAKWGEISFALYTWEKKPQNGWSGDDFDGPIFVGITSAEIALNTLDLLKRPRILCINKTMD